MKKTKIKTYYKLVDSMGREGSVRFPTFETARQGIDFVNGKNQESLNFFKKLGADTSHLYQTEMKSVIECTHVEGAKIKKGDHTYKVSFTGGTWKRGKKL
jgi:hypothetical protein